MPFQLRCVVAMVCFFAIGACSVVAAPQPTLVEELAKYDGPGYFSAENSDVGMNLRKRISALSDKELEDSYDQLHHTQHWRSAGPDLLISEMVSRGGTTWEKFIQGQIDKQVAADARETTQPAAPHPPIIDDIVLLTALRRIQRKDDPLPILIEGEARISFNVGFAPAITTNLTNLDCDKSILRLGTGGDYRGAARHNRYRLQITDAAGKVLPERDDPDMGGILGGTTLQSHDSYPMSLQIGAYVQIDKPGRYTMVVQYHPMIRLALLSNVDGLVVCQSKPIHLIVSPIEIETNDPEQAEVAAMIAQLPDKGAVKILGGSYTGEAAGKFLPKESPAAKIQMKGWNSVPALIRAVNGDKLNPTQRAWAFGLLYGITSRNDPMNVPGVMGPYEYRFSGWVSTSNSGGWGSYSESQTSQETGTIDAKAQTELAKKWHVWLENGSIERKPPRRD